MGAGSACLENDAGACDHEYEEVDDVTEHAPERVHEMNGARVDADGAPRRSVHEA